MIACTAFVDAAYVRAELLHAGHNGRFNPWHALEESVLHHDHHDLDDQPIASIRRLFFYDAIDDADSEKTALHDEYLDHVESLPNTHLSMGVVRGRRGNRRQKGVDIALAVDALEEATARHPDAIVLVSGDADFVPLAHAIRRAGPYVWVVAFARSLAADLAVAADEVFEIEEVVKKRWMEM